MLGRSWAGCPYEGYCRASTEALCVLTVDGRFQFASSAWEAVSGRKLDALLGQSLTDLVPENERAIASAALAAVRAGEASSADHRVVGPDRSVRWCAGCRRARSMTAASSRLPAT